MLESLSVVRPRIAQVESAINVVGMRAAIESASGGGRGRSHSTPGAKRE